MAIGFDLLSREMEEKAARHLTNEIEKADNTKAIKQNNKQTKQRRRHTQNTGRELLKKYCNE